MLELIFIYFSLNRATLHIIWKHVNMCTIARTRNFTHVMFTNKYLQNFGNYFWFKIIHHHK